MLGQDTYRYDPPRSCSYMIRPVLHDVITICHARITIDHDIARTRR